MPLHAFFLHAFSAVWLVTAGVWAVGACVAKPAERTQSRSSRLLDIFWAFLVFFLLFRAFPSSMGTLTHRFVPQSSPVVAVGLALTVAGLAFAIWARFHLGGNWSGRVTIKKDHTLVLGGPYAIVRHPIYTGFLFAIFGTVLAVGEVRALIAVAVALFFLKRKANLEEKFMIDHFGAAYLEYRRHVKSLLPYIW